MKRLEDAHCHAQLGAPLGRDAITALQPEVPGWELADDLAFIRREFVFSNFYETMAFVNAVAWVSHVEDHHPDLSVSYSRCAIRLSTHSVGGLSENDFICAAKINALQVEK